MDGNLPWNMILAGAAIAVVIEILGIPVMPVSYTHLDVYKRQPHTIIQTDMGIGQNPFLASVSIALHILLQYNLIRP